MSRIRVELSPLMPAVRRSRKDVRRLSMKTKAQTCGKIRLASFQDGVINAHLTVRIPGLRTFNIPIKNKLLAQRLVKAGAKARLKPTVATSYGSCKALNLSVEQYLLDKKLNMALESE